MRLSLLARPLDELRSVVHTAIRHRELIVEMTRRELTAQHRGAILGSMWALGHPLFLMCLYIFVFGLVFRIRIGGTHELPLDYVVYLLAGLVPWLAFQQAMVKGTTALTSQSSLVKQVVFPIEILPLSTTLSTCLMLGVGLAVIIAYTLVVHDGLAIFYCLLPLVVVLQLAAMIGTSLLLAAVAPFFRDLKDIVQVFGVAGVYLMPVVYLPEWVPGLFEPVLYVNPFSYLVWCYQDVLYFGRFEHPLAWWFLGISAPLVLASGFAFFRFMKPYYGNVL